MHTIPFGRSPWYEANDVCDLYVPRGVRSVKVEGSRGEARVCALWALSSVIALLLGPGLVVELA